MTLWFRRVTTQRSSSSPTVTATARVVSLSRSSLSAWWVGVLLTTLGCLCHSMRMVHVHVHSLRLGGSTFVRRAPTMTRPPRAIAGMVMWGESGPSRSFVTFDEPDQSAQQQQQQQRTFRRQNPNDNNNENENGGGWDDFDDTPRRQGKRSSSSSSSSWSRGPPRRNDYRTSRKGGPPRRNQPQGRDRDRDGYRERGGPRHDRDREANNERKTNLRALEKAGFEHLYGIAPVRNALAFDRRDLRPADDQDYHGSLVDNDVDVDVDDNVDRDVDVVIVRKPEARFTPYLFVQDTLVSTQNKAGRKGAQAVGDLIAMAESRGVPVAYVDKGVLNTLSNNRPHQGFVLRCREYELIPMSELPPPPLHKDDDVDGPQLWLVLDEVMDPQNFGALLRSAYFFGADADAATEDNNDDDDDNDTLSNRPKPKVGVMICAKNSCPPSPTVSASSAGALEGMDVHFTTNLPHTLHQAREDGWRVLGTAAKPMAGVDGIIPCTDLTELTCTKHDKVVLVLGSEGHGLRSLVAKACTEFVRIPGTNGAVDSLNVSVTGGILLWTILHQI